MVSGKVMKGFFIEKTFQQIIMYIYGDLGLLYKKVAFRKKKARSFSRVDDMMMKDLFMFKMCA